MVKIIFLFFNQQFEFYKNSIMNQNILSFLLKKKKQMFYFLFGKFYFFIFN